MAPLAPFRVRTLFFDFADQLNLPTLALLKVLKLEFRGMPSSEVRLGRWVDKLGIYAERFEEIFETKFERVARNPRVLAFVGNSFNLASAIRLESRKLEAEAASFRARAKVAFKKRPETPAESQS